MIKINENIYLKIFEKSLIPDFFKEIHSNKNTKDKHVESLLCKFDEYEKLEKRMNDAIDNKYECDGSPDFFIFYREKIVGVFEFHPLVEGDFVEIGYWLFPSYRQKRILSTILPRMIRFAKIELKKNKVIAITSIHNKASKRLLERSGFQKTGKILEVEKELGQLEQEVEYLYDTSLSSKGI